MERKAMKSLLCIGVVLVLATVFAAEAGAVTCSTSKTLSTQTCCGWKTTSSGTKYCSLWCAGSEICVNTIFGLGGNVFGDCNPDDPTTICPVTSCDAFGTVTPEGSTEECDNTNLLNLNPNCGITGIAYCQNHGGNSKLRNPKIQGQPFVVSGVEGTDIPVASVDCDKQGKCTTQGKLEADLSAIICQNPNWTPLTFTASEFKGRTCFCPGGYDDFDACCEDSERTGPDGAKVCSNIYAAEGSNPGKPTCILSLCTLDLSTYNPITNFDLAYDCSEVEFCGGFQTLECPGA